MDKKEVVSILIVGVGGQGTLLASKILGQVIMEANLDVKMSEVHGMAQRGGSVVTHVRFGGKIYSPLIPTQGADILISFELLETLRWLAYLKANGKVIVNEQMIPPMPVISGDAVYPESPVLEIAGMGLDVTGLRAYQIAKECGNINAANVVMLGVLAKKLGFDREIWEKVIKNTVRPGFLELNLKAFDRGFNYSI